MSDRTSIGISSRREDVWWYLRILGCNAPLAERLTGDTFAQETMQHTPESDATVGRARRLRIKARQSFADWLVVHDRPVDNAALDVIDELWIKLGLDADINAITAREALLVQLDELGATAKSAIELRFCEGLGYSSIGAQLNIPESEVRTLLRSTTRDLLTALLVRPER